VSRVVDQEAAVEVHSLGACTVLAGAADVEDNRVGLTPGDRIVDSVGVKRGFGKGMPSGYIVH